MGFERFGRLGAEGSRNSGLGLQISTRLAAGVAVHREEYRGPQNPCRLAWGTTTVGAVAFATHGLPHPLAHGSHGHATAHLPLLTLGHVAHAAHAALHALSAHATHPHAAAHTAHVAVHHSAHAGHAVHAAHAHAALAHLVAGHAHAAGHAGHVVAHTSHPCVHPCAHPLHFRKDGGLLAHPR